MVVMHYLERSTLILRMLLFHSLSKKILTEVSERFRVSNTLKGYDVHPRPCNVVRNSSCKD